MTGADRVEWSARALSDIGRLAEFLRRNNPAAAARAVRTIRSAADSLRDFPARGRPYGRAPERYRELIVPFGQDGYELLYQIRSDHVRIAGVKHMREAGY